MRLAVLADVHANLPALEAIVALLERERPDRWVVAGDLVGYGPHPDACVERIVALDPVCVAGNHDLIAIGRLSTDRCIPLARESLEWTAATISAATRDALAALPPLAEIGDVIVAHGSLDDPQEYVRTPEAARAQLDLLSHRHPAARVLVIGHTHKAMAVGAGATAEAGAAGLGGAAAGDAAGPPRRDVALAADDRHLLNPGSVGQSRSAEPKARALLLDLGVRRATFVEAEYDVEAVRADLRRHGLDPLSSHMPPAPFPGAYRLRRIARRALGRRPRAGSAAAPRDAGRDDAQA
ncbi:MAG TPA: metallophosphoesterase [Solirubrobacteraceae bacterium]|jgi:predicted phosphodiesterase